MAHFAAPGYRLKQKAGIGLLSGKNIAHLAVPGYRLKPAVSFVR
jgi:hypothetical protein